MTLAGFYETELTPARARRPGDSACCRHVFEAFNANAYRFEVPAGATELARGPVPQAFRVGERAWAVQFHPEIRREHVLRWFEDDSTPRTPEEIARELDEKLEQWQTLGRRFCRAFLAAATR